MILQSEQQVLKVIAIDPGRTTGYCQAEIRTGKLHYHVFQEIDEVEDLWHRLDKLKPRFIICEDFDFRGGHHRAATGIDYFPIQLIGVANLYAAIAPHQCACYMQKAAQGKAYYTNPVLKDQGYLKRGMATSVPHGIDAMRHLFQWFTFGPGFKYNTAMHNEPFAIEASGI
jgi:hypothetical protein